MLASSAGSERDSDMNRQKWIILIAALGLIGGAACLLTRLQSTQKLGQPAVKTTPIPGSQRLRVDLPEHVLDYTSEEIEVDDKTLGWLPQDTSFGQRRYRAPDGFTASINVVLMGRDRTSLHQTEFCVEGAGWRIDRSLSSESKVHIDRPYPYELPVMKFIAAGQITSNGQQVPAQDAIARRREARCNRTAEQANPDHADGVHMRRLPCLL